MLLEGFTIQRTWGLDVVNDFFMAGASFGAFLCASLFLVFNLKKYEIFTLFSLVIALVCTLAMPFNLIDDLKQPSRVIQFFLNGWGNLLTSPMKWGVILLMIYPLCLMILIFLQIKQKECKKLAIFTLFLAFCIPGYTGYILGASVGVSFWNTPILPLIFIANGAVGGVGVLSFILFIYLKIESQIIDFKPLLRLSSYLIGLDLLLRFFWLSFMLGFNKEIKELYHYIFTARFYEIFLLEFALICIIVISLFTRLSANLFFIMLANLAMIIYSFAFKFNVVFSGQAMPKIMAGVLDFSPKISGQDSLMSVLANWLICICIFSLIAYFLPLKNTLKDTK